MQHRQATVIGSILAFMVIAVAVSLLVSLGILPAYNPGFSQPKSTSTYAPPPCPPDGAKTVDVTTLTINVYNGEVQILSSKGSLTNAYSLAQVFPNSTVKIDESLSDDDATVSVVLGKEYLQNALNADEIKLLGSDKPITAPSDCVPADKSAKKKSS